jgi:hypothetical protein
VKTFRVLVGLVALSVLTGASDSQALAQFGWWGAWPGCYPYLSAPYTYSYGSVPTPPYFAIHPPVYYGPRIRMAYGHSPIARPPLTVVDVGTRGESPEAPLQTGLAIRNPFVADASAQSGHATVAARPQIVVNPYFSPDEPQASSEPRIAARPPGVATDDD